MQLFYMKTLSITLLYGGAVYFFLAGDDLQQRE
jgi:hypothetical protein